MVEAPSLQPQHCEECGQQKMSWTVSTSDVSGDQEINTDTKRRNFSLNALFGKQSELTTESSDADGLKNADGDTESFHFCPDVSCKNHLDGVGDVITWKAVNASTEEYSEAEIDQRIAEVLEQSVQDDRMVVETVEDIYGTVTQNATENESSTGETSDTESTITEGDTDESAQTHTGTEDETTPLQQLDPCKACEEQQKTKKTSRRKDTTEQQSNKETNRSVYSVAASSSFVPFIEAGGETESSDETTVKETSKISTADTATFPYCPTRTCKEHLLMLGQIECWKRRNDSTRDYSAEELDDIVRNTLEQEVRRSQIISKNVEEVYDKLFSDSQEQKQETDTAMSSSDESETTTPSESSADTDDSSKKQTGAEGDRIRSELLTESVDGWEKKNHSKEMNNRKDDDSDPSPSL